MIIIEDGNVELYGEAREILSDTTLLLYHILKKYKSSIDKEKLFSALKEQIENIEKQVEIENGNGK